MLRINRPSARKKVLISSPYSWPYQNLPIRWCVETTTCRNWSKSTSNSAVLTFTFAFDLTLAHIKIEKKNWIWHWTDFWIWIFFIYSVRIAFSIWLFSICMHIESFRLRIRSSWDVQNEDDPNQIEFGIENVERKKQNKKEFVHLSTTSSSSSYRRETKNCWIFGFGIIIYWYI